LRGLTRKSVSGTALRSILQTSLEVAAAGGHNLLMIGSRAPESRCSQHDYLAAAIAD